MYYIYSVEDTTAVQVAVEASDSLEADTVLDDWLSSDEGEEIVYDLLNRSQERELLSEFSTTSMHERPNVDYYIRGPKKRIEEPLYSLHIDFHDGKMPYTHREMTMHELASELCGWSSRYKLIPNDDDSIPWHYSKSNKSADGRSTWLWMSAEAR